MSSITLNSKVLEKNNLTLGEALFLIMLANNVDIEESKDSLLKKGFIGNKLNPETYEEDGFFITRFGSNSVTKAVIDADPKVGTSDFAARIETLVPQLQEVYPTGKNFNNQYWRGNKTDIKRKLQTFFKKYGDSFTDEQLLNATRAYVTSFNGDYKFMRLLQYFIWKEETKDGTKVVVSSLADHIENEGQESSLDNFNWMGELN